MSQNSIIDSGTQSSKTSSLKPALATALGSLEVQLDQELTRYRRTRNGVRQPQQVSVKNYGSHQTQQLNTMTQTWEKTQPSLPELNTNAIPPENPALQVKKQEQINPDQQSSDQLSSDQQSSDQQSSDQQSDQTSTPPPPLLKSISSIVPTKVKTAESETLVPANDPPKHPDDYLESSEALLRSLNEEQPQTKKLSGSNDNLLSPLGIGSMLLLLLASLTLGYVVFNPQTLPQLNLGKLFNRDSSSNAENTGVAEKNSAPIAPPEITSIPKYPNLAAREFPEVKDPNDVVGLRPKIKPTPTVIPQPIETPINSVVPLTSVPSITPNPKQTLPGLDTEIKPSADGFYYLVADNQGNGALAAAQKVVPDAYLSDGQKYIYLGVSKTKEEANQKLQMLKAKGIQAHVRKP